HGQGVPTGGQGVPTQDGQGVPTHGRAPMLTTPVKRSSRECARDRDECQPADFAGRTDEQFERARRAWPSGFADSREDAWQAWGELTEAEQVDAVDEIPRFVAATRSVGRKLFCGFAAYLRERKWQALPPRPKPIERKPAQPPTPRGPSPFERKHAQEFPQLFSGDAPVAGPSPIEKRMRDSEALST
ncbi:hypothetical protein, partial [Mesorhizobium sp.]|uniref:hypothetical protein n=1 Tax=Mesorhizobium sp. TaxID=1871066 RepID=UPI0025BCD546